MAHFRKPDTLRKECKSDIRVSSRWLKMEWSGRHCTLRWETCFRRETGAGVRATIVAMKQGNACGAKGGRKVDMEMNRKRKDTLTEVPMRASHARVSKLNYFGDRCLTLNVKYLKDNSIISFHCPL